MKKICRKYEIKYKGKIYTAKILAERAGKQTRWAADMLKQVTLGIMKMKTVLEIADGRPYKSIPKKEPIYEHADPKTKKITVYTVDQVMNVTGLTRQQAQRRLYNVIHGFQKFDSLLAPPVWKARKRTGKLSHLPDTMTPERREKMEQCRLAGLGKINQNEYLRS